MSDSIGRFFHAGINYFSKLWESKPAQDGKASLYQRLFSKSDPSHYQSESKGILGFLGLRRYSQVFPSDSPKEDILSSQADIIIKQKPHAQRFRSVFESRKVVPMEIELTSMKKNPLVSIDEVGSTVSSDTNPLSENESEVSISDLLLSQVDPSTISEPEEELPPPLDSTACKTQDIAQTVFEKEAGKMGITLSSEEKENLQTKVIEGSSERVVVVRVLGSGSYNKVSLAWDCQKSSFVALRECLGSSPIDIENFRTQTGKVDKIYHQLVDIGVDQELLEMPDILIGDQATSIRPLAINGDLSKYHGNYFVNNPLSLASPLIHQLNGFLKAGIVMLDVKLANINLHGSLDHPLPKFSDLDGSLELSRLSEFELTKKSEEAFYEEFSQCSPEEKDYIAQMLSGKSDEEFFISYIYRRKSLSASSANASSSAQRTLLEIEDIKESDSGSLIRVPTKLSDSGVLEMDEESFSSVIITRPNQMKIDEEPSATFIVRTPQKTESDEELFSSLVIIPPKVNLANDSQAKQVPRTDKEEVDGFRSKYEQMLKGPSGDFMSLLQDQIGDRIELPLTPVFSFGHAMTYFQKQSQWRSDFKIAIDSACDKKSFAPLAKAFEESNITLHNIDIRATGYSIILKIAPEIEGVFEDKDVKKGQKHYNWSDVMSGNREAIEKVEQCLARSQEKLGDSGLSHLQQEILIGMVSGRIQGNASGLEELKKFF